MEELVLDTKTGRAVNASLMDYKIPSAEDVPAVMSVDFVETPQKDGPMGARGIGEHTMIPTPAAIANALFDACGIRIARDADHGREGLEGAEGEGRGGTRSLDGDAGARRRVRLNAADVSRRAGRRG